MKLKSIILIIVGIMTAIMSYVLITHSADNNERPLDQNKAQTGVLADVGWRKVDQSSLNASNDQTIPAIANKYSDPKYHFTFSYPDGFKVRTINTDNYYIVVVENGHDSTIGFQLAISLSPTPTLGQNELRAIAGSLAIKDPQMVTVGAGSGGIAFVSDNQSFGGNSREVWFVYDGNLYQISTYMKNDALLRAVLGSWNFRD